ncbi:MAG: hypothetical protein COW85_12870 [Ignavibacteria bacterium CG22_combo_CG10-13_8_21_14_all_37_15]|nr:MAG: hypothetical protein AUJ54_12615 [Ignavibacteria bacterium CG1_02_37_35]PIP76691.1 MAG: hypothetical protein COW85_12870 [Ignavibacteria bacterium CG22_combo_CG10-13_8_21_14_all_37_15]
MKVFYDNEVDAAYIKFSNKKPSQVLELSDGFNVDVNEKKEIIGLEILDASKRIPLDSLFNWAIDKKQFITKRKSA